MHNHRLHHPVSAVCECCRLPSCFVFHSPHEPIVCKGCRRHIGDSVEARHLRDSDHASLYLSEIHVLQEDLDQARVQQRADYQRQIDSLQSQLDAKVTETAEQAELIVMLGAAVRSSQIDSGLAEWFADEEVVEALKERDRARRATGLVLEALSRLTLIHGLHDKRAHYCMCGKHVDQCPEYRAIESEFAVLAKWDREQFLRHTEGLEHALCAEKIRRMELSA